MQRTAFNDGWQFRKKVNPFAESSGTASEYTDVVIPHDAQIVQPRDPNGEGATAYFPSGTYEYRKTFGPVAADQHVVLEFEGVYRDSMVYVNGSYAGQRPSGYAAFTIDATPFIHDDGENEVRVETRNHRDSRWYTGAGIYRDVWLLTGGELHIVPSGLRVTAPDVDDERAVVEVTVTIANTARQQRSARLALVIGPDDSDADTLDVTVAAGETTTIRQRFYVAHPDRWSAETPHLYTARAELRRAGSVVDTVSTEFGIRTLQLDPVHGLRVNGESVKLRGTCLHHDNGILGAATFEAAEERRVLLLKEAGFNAIRSSHNPISSAMLRACDRHGVYVMDETFDMWTSTKTDFDYSLDFAEWWERDVESMVAKDFNHPSVLFYSIGNEIPQTGSPSGGVLSRRIAEHVRSLDPTRFVTNGINGMLAVIDDLKKLFAEHGGAADESVGINTMMTSPGEAMNTMGSSSLVTEKTAESFAALDLAGMNYLNSRYETDQEAFPHRIIVGSETFPASIAQNWGLVERLGSVIGDFTWTGWDYLGEVGLGRPTLLTPDNPMPDLGAPYPWIAAWCGDIDLVGHRRPMSYYREIVFGLRKEPYIAVLRPEAGRGGVPASAWAWSDSVASWTWPVEQDTPLTVEVYSDAEQVELLLDGESIGVAAAGPDRSFKATFDVPFRPGELTAVAHRGGTPAERHTLASAAGELTLRLSREQLELAHSNGVLEFVAIELTDAAGVLVSSSDRDVTITVDGPAVLHAAGSGHPAPEVPYTAATQSTFDGRALAVVRRIGDGAVTVSVSSGALQATTTL